MIVIVSMGDEPATADPAVAATDTGDSDGEALGERFARRWKDEKAGEEPGEGTAPTTAAAEI